MLVSRVLIGGIGASRPALGRPIFSRPVDYFYEFHNAQELLRVMEHGVAIRTYRS
jgi:hypothetical protein